MKSNKTWKRETAWAILLWVFYLSIWGSIDALTLVIYPAFGFILAAFGFDWTHKQLQWGKSSQSTNRIRTERSGQHPSGEGQLPDDWEDK